MDKQLLLVCIDDKKCNSDSMFRFANDSLTYFVKKNVFKKTECVN